MSAKEEFINLMSENSKVHGLDELSSRILGILFLETNEISLEDLSKKAKYSLSAVSTSMKFLERTGTIKRLKKPNSRKVFFYMEKDMMGMLMQIMQRKLEKIIIPTKQKLPAIINKYKKEKSKKSKDELKIIEEYHNQVIDSEEILIKTMKIIKDVQNKHKK